VKRTSFTPLFTPRKPKNDYTYIQFVRTYGKADQQAKDRHRKYALVGDFSYGKLLGHAIDNAKRFIYIEDQFFFDTNTPSASLDDRLKAAVARGVTIVVVAARMNEIESPPGGLTERRAALIKDLRANVAGKDRLYLLQYKLQSPAPQPYFVHTKTWIFDDQLAVIGSANYWTESMTTESEFGVAIASTLSTKEFPGVPFARALRVKMWERLLKAVPGAPVLKRDKKATFLQELAVLTGKGSPFEPMP
jgi:phosphatidylserine/phosphatidylglycerophosphate/cardiolipin synthase-like enzyme